MAANIASASSLSQKTVMGLPVKKEFMFTNPKGVEKAGIKKRQIKLLKKLEFLPRFLKKDEEVLLVTTACSPASMLEQLTTGWIIYYLKRSLLVFTNKRILHIPTTIGYNFRHSIAEIRYNDCEQIKMGWRALKFKYRNGKTEKFLYVHGKERKKIRALAGKFKLTGDPSRHQQRHHICPSCSASLALKNWSCPACRLKFKEMGRARWLSLLIPGGGYFYTGHWFLGLGDFIVEAGLTLLIITSLTEPSSSSSDPQFTAIFFLVILVIEKLITVYHAGHYVREFIPVDTNYKKRVSI
jgi:hypothetical protein